MPIADTISYVESVHQSYEDFILRFDTFIESTITDEIYVKEDIDNPNDPDFIDRSRPGLIGHLRNALIALKKKLKETIDKLIKAIKDLFAHKKKEEIKDMEKMLNSSDEFKKRNITLIKIDEGSKYYDKAIADIDKEIAAIRSKKTLSEADAKKIEDRISEITADAEKKVKTAKLVTMAVALPAAFALMLKVVKREEEDAIYDRDDFDPVLGYQDGMTPLHMRMLFKMYTKKANLIEKKHLERNNFITNTLSKIKSSLKGDKGQAAEVDVLDKKGKAKKDVDTSDGGDKGKAFGKATKESRKKVGQIQKDEFKAVKKNIEKIEAKEPHRKLEDIKKEHQAKIRKAVAENNAKNRKLEKRPNKEFDESVEITDTDEYLTNLIDEVDGELKTEAYEAHKGKDFYFKNTKKLYGKLKNMMNDLEDDSITTEKRIKIAKDASNILTELMAQANKIPDDDIADALFDINLLLNGLNKLFAKFKSYFTFTGIVTVKRHTQRGDVLKSLRKIQQKLNKEIASLEKELKEKEKLAKESAEDMEGNESMNTEELLNEIVESVESNNDFDANEELRKIEESVDSVVTVGEYLESVEEEILAEMDETEVEASLESADGFNAEDVLKEIEESVDGVVTVGEYLEDLEKEILGN